LLEATRWSKRFGGRTVLDTVDLTVAPGEIHALLGQNGSGKSTFIKILAGVHRPEAGATLKIRGRDVHLPLRPGQARTLGVSFVHQDLGLVPTGTVLENLGIGQYRTRLGWYVPWKSEARRARALLAEFGLEIDPGARVEELWDVDRALLAIVRALEELRGHPGGVLVLDEPTAYLPRDGVERLFAAVRRVSERGFGVIFVTHRLEEVTALAHIVSVLRDGRLVWRGSTVGLTEDDLVERILGFSLGQLYPDYNPARGDVVASIRDLAGATLKGCSADIRRGEILGVTGLLGMGHDEIPYLLFGAQRAVNGTVTLGGREIAVRSLTPAAAMRMGMALLPADRLRLGGVGAATVLENATMPTLAGYFRHGLLRHGTEESAVQALLQDFDVHPAAPSLPLRMLSGGNQQKVLVGKWFETRPGLFLMHEPTHGVDVGAKRQIFQRITNAAAQGTAVLLASAEYEDMANICDRVIVFRHGEAVAELAGGQLTADRILDQCFRQAGAGIAINQGAAHE
jgi:ribose transport system ATP-binding protein